VVSATRGRDEAGRRPDRPKTRKNGGLAPRFEVHGEPVIADLDKSAAATEQLQISLEVSSISLSPATATRQVK
jgi:hypothetical protein